ncbi:MAG: PQQ-binding-like beta-propeller repeat protein [Clostridiaceae bacterium]|nr:PQQ-binding-like beta-propeller repeat protein [Clostridiaceae bacterium]
MRIKRLFFLLLFLTVIASILLVLTSKKPSDTNASQKDITTAPTITQNASPSEMPATPTPTHAPVIETVTPEYTQHVINPKDVNPDILPVYDGDNAFAEYAKEKKFGDTVFKFWHFLGFDIVTSDVENPDIYFGAADSYTDVEGITTFRGNHYRDSAAYGTRRVAEKKLELVWTKDIGSVSTGSSYWPGVGWTGQPLIVHWDEDIRKLMNIKSEFKNIDLVEVIYPTLDGNIYFLNLEDGKPTRNPINIGFSTKGTGMIDPRGYPILYTGQGLNQNGDNFAHHEFRIFSLIDQTELFSITGTTPEAFRVWGAFDPSPLLHKETDTLIQPGENGILYRIKMNTDFNRETGDLSIDPEVTKYRYEGIFDPNIGFENSPVFYKNYLYLADNGGLLQCIDINTLEPVWIANLEDDTDATIVLEETHEGVFIYTGNEVDLRAIGKPQPAYADCQLRKFNALTGELIWERSYSCIYQNGVNGGLLSTPVLGKNDISDIVIFNICKTTDWKSGKMVALDKKTGEEVWVKDLANYSWSSPVDFLSDEGKTYMIFCDFAGEMHLMDPANGEILDTISVGLNVEASPAIYNDMVVVGTYAKKIYGIRIK